MKENPLPSREQVYQALELKLQQMHSEAKLPDVITFAGNGEPTLHPEFEGIIDDTILLRNRYCPDSKVSVLSNSTRVHKPAVFRALMKVENNILKFDSAVDETVQRLDRPTGKTFNVQWVINQLKRFEGKLIIQTMFLRGMVDGELLDNTTEKEINAWLDALREIKPNQVMIYSIDRETPTSGLEKLTHEELESIAMKARAAGFTVSVAG
jgi:wyosine [tRNA(Phe)-imidazoG37] synthetase (radical SAM superfamily)